MGGQPPLRDPEIQMPIKPTLVIRSMATALALCASWGSEVRAQTAAPTQAAPEEAPKPPEQIEAVAPAPTSPSIVTVEPPQEQRTVVVQQAPPERAEYLVVPHRRARTPGADRRSETSDRLDTIDLTVTTALFGAYMANAIVSIADVDETYTAKYEDTVRIRFATTVLGALFGFVGFGISQTDIPRGVGSGIAIGLRGGVLISALTLSLASPLDEDAAHGVVLGMGFAGAAIGGLITYSLRPHPSRLRFVETGMVWGPLAGASIGYALADRRSGNAAAIGALAGLGSSLAIHMLIAQADGGSPGRGWLLNLGFAAGFGLGQFFTWGFSGSTADDQVRFGVGAGVGIAGVVVMGLLTQGMTGEDWMPEELARLTPSVEPVITGGQMVGGTLSISGTL